MSKKKQAKAAPPQQEGTPFYLREQDETQPEPWKENQPGGFPGYAEASKPKEGD